MGFWFDLRSKFSERNFGAVKFEKYRVLVLPPQNEIQLLLIFFCFSKLNRPLALRGHVTNASFKQ